MINKYWLIAALSLVVIGICCIPAFAGFSDDYTHNQDVELTNSGTQPIAQPLVIDDSYFNITSLIAYNFIQPNADDITIDYLGNEEFITVVDLSGSPSMRTEYVNIPVGDTIKKTIWFGDASGTRNQSWIASSGDTNTCSGTQLFFSGTEAFAIRAEVTPAANPGTRQDILGVDGSYLLSYDPGPMYRWYCIGSGAFTASATISAVVDQTARLIAWHNGPGGEIMLCNALTGSCSQSMFSDLVLGGTIIPPLTFDGVIDELSIRVPDFPASGTPPGAPGTPPGNGSVASACVGEFWLEPTITTCYGRDYNDGDPNNDSDDWTELFKYTAGQSDLCDSTTYGYGIDFVNNEWAQALFNGVDAGDVSYYSDDQLVQEVSLSFSINNYCDSCYILRLWAIDNPDDMANLGALEFIYTYVGTTAYSTAYTVTTGSLTLDMYGTNWTIGKLKDYYWWIRAVVWPHCDRGNGTIQCGSLGPYDNYDCSDVDWYIQDFTVRYRVAP